MSNQKRSENDYWLEAKNLRTHVHHKIANDQKATYNDSKNNGVGTAITQFFIIVIIVGGIIAWAYNQTQPVNNVPLDSAPVNLPSIQR